MFINIAGIFLLILIISGCADIKVPTMHYALGHPLSTKTMVIPGTSKEKILEKWGEPSQKIDMGFDDVGLKKEAWIYEPWFPHLPLDYRYLSRKKKIYFVGDYAVGYEDMGNE